MSVTCLQSIKKDKLKALHGFAITNYAIVVNFNTNIPCKNYRVAKLWPYLPFCPSFPTRYKLLECEGKCKYEKNRT